MNREEVSILRIRRFNPERQPSSFVQEYMVPFIEGNTILDALYYIYCNIDQTLAFRGSCFQGGYCNVCMVRVNGKPLIPCKHFMEREMLIEPISGFEVLRDLIVDYSAKRHNEVFDADTIGMSECRCAKDRRVPEA